MGSMKDLLGDDLFDYALRGARATDPDTSHQAAGIERGADRRAALQSHFDHPTGLTDFELAAMMHRQQTSAGKRRGELRDLGYIEQTSERRPAPSGSNAIVWRITQKGIAAVILS